MGIFDEWRKALKSALEAKKNLKRLVIKQKLGKKALVNKKALISNRAARTKDLALPEAPTTPIILGTKPSITKNHKDKMTPQEEKNVRNIMTTLKEKKLRKALQSVFNGLSLMSDAGRSIAADRIFPPVPAGFLKAPQKGKGSSGRQ